MKKTTLTSQAIRRPFSSFAAAAFLVSLITLWSGQNAHATIFTLSIPDTVAWTDTGINIASGTELEISASGTVTYGFSTGQSTGPNGGDTGSQQFFADAVVPSAVIHSLIGKTGGTTAVGNGTPVPEGTPGDGAGFVGASYDKIISSGGDAGAARAASVVVAGDVVHVDFAGRSVPFRLAPAPDVDRAARVAAAHHGGGPVEIVAPMPGAILAVHVAVGATVEAADSIVTLEAMKMEHAVAAPIPGRISDLRARPGDQVARGDVLAVVEP